MRQAAIETVRQETGRQNDMQTGDRPTKRQADRIQAGRLTGRQETGRQSDRQTGGRQETGQTGQRIQVFLHNFCFCSIIEQAMVI
jgi:hypothetical protein